MTEFRRAIMQRIGEYFELEPENEDGTYNIHGYNWVSGCSMGNREWLTLAKIVGLAEEIVNDYAGRELTYDDIVEEAGAWFELEPGEDGTYDTDSYDFQAGCKFGNMWLTLSSAVDCIDETIKPDRNDLLAIKEQEEEMER